MPCRSQAARTAAARLSSIVPSALAPVSSCRSMNRTSCRAAQATASLSGNLRPISTPIRSRRLIASSVMFDIAADIAFPGDVAAVHAVAGLLVGPSDAEIARHLRMHRHLRLAQHDVDALAQ